MQRMKVRIFSGVVCEQIVYNISDRVRDVKKAKPRLRFKNEEERAAHRLGMSRRYHARLVNENFGPTSYYSTLTIDNEHEVHTFDEARNLRGNYVRRLLYDYPEAKIMIYMGRGKSTKRIHMHMISEGIPEEVILKKWGLGRVTECEHLREHNYYNGKDYGQDYTGLANYLFDHWTEEQGGHRWKATKNLEKPENEPPKVVEGNYSLKRPPATPNGYILVEKNATPYGYLYYKYVKEPPPNRRGQKIKSGTS